MEYEELTSYIAETVDNLDKIIQYFKLLDNKTRETDIAIQRLEEAVFWLTYGEENTND